ncbi:MAG: hypothetical protein ABJB74_13515 [Gemmatimonas sp.]
MRIKPGNQAIPNAIVTWGYWGVNAYACTDNAKSTECLIHVGNGSDKSESLCLGNASLLFTAADSIAVALKTASEDKPATASPSVKASSGMFCVTVPAHGRRSIIAPLGSIATRKPLGLAISFEERVGDGPALAARTRMPLLVITP